MSKRSTYTHQNSPNPVYLAISRWHLDKHNHSHNTHIKWGLPKTTSNPNKVQDQQSRLTELKPPILAFITRNRISRGMQGHMGWGYVSWLCLSERRWPGTNSCSLSLVCRRQNTPDILTASIVDPNIKPSNYFTNRVLFYPAETDSDKTEILLNRFYGGGNCFPSLIGVCVCVWMCVY